MSNKSIQFLDIPLRHSSASHCAEAGVPKAVLLSILGTDSEIADKYYTHIGDDSQRGKTPKMQ